MKAPPVWAQTLVLLFILLVLAASIPALVAVLVGIAHWSWDWGQSIIP